MTPTTFTLEQSGPVCTLSLTTKKGSLPPQFWAEFTKALQTLEQAAGEGQTRALVVRGPECFSAGLDVQATLPAIAKVGDFWQVVRPMQEAFTALERLPVPTIAAIHSHCIGAGLELAAACDLRLCSAEASFSLPEVRLGMVADLGGLQRLPNLIGRGRTVHLALTAAPIDAATAERWGLVTGVFPTAQTLYAEAEATASALAKLPAHAINGTTKVLQHALPLEEGLQQAGGYNAAALPQLLAEAAGRRG